MVNITFGRLMPFILLGFGLVSGIWPLAQSQANQFDPFGDQLTLSGESLMSCNLAKFDTYQVAIQHSPRASDVRFGQFPNAKHHETDIQLALSNGVNFAGHYAASVWGCGTNCIGLGIIDTTDGSVKFYSGQGLTFGKLVPGEENHLIPLGVMGRPNSTLLVVNPTCATGTGLAELRNTVFGESGLPRYYIWDGTYFEHIK